MPLRCSAHSILEEWHMVESAIMQMKTIKKQTLLFLFLKKINYYDTEIKAELCVFSVGYKYRSFCSGRKSLSLIWKFLSALSWLQDSVSGTVSPEEHVSFKHDSVRNPKTFSRLHQGMSWSLPGWPYKKGFSASTSNFLKLT